MFLLYKGTAKKTSPEIHNYLFDNDLTVFYKSTTEVKHAQKIIIYGDLTYCI